MDKEQVLQTIKESIDKNIITRHDVQRVIGAPDKAYYKAPNGGFQNSDGPSSGSMMQDDRNSLIPKVLYTIGGVIAVIGVVVMLSSNWDTIGFLGKWLVTVGFGLVTFISAFLLYKKPEHNVLSQVFFTISAIVMFIGGFVWIDAVAVVPWDAPNAYLLVSSILFAIFGAALYAARKPMLHILATIFFSIAYYACISESLKGSGFGLWALKDVMVYASMILGVAYLMYGSWIDKTASGEPNMPSAPGVSSGMPNRLVRIYTFFAFALFLFSALFLGGVWNFLYAFLAIGAVMLSINLKSGTGLLVTSVAIGTYCVKISIQYFAQSISFSLALLFSGLLIIALGYLTYYLNKKYIKQQN
jgi:hypothetical protein